MALCENELNSQLKSLQARVSQAEDDIVAHYAGLSQLSLSLLANPFTSASAAASALIYNAGPMGMKLVRGLMQAMIPKELLKTMRMLTMLSAQDILESAEGIASNMLTTATSNVISMVDHVLVGVADTVKNDIYSIIHDIEQLDDIILQDTKYQILAKQEKDNYNNSLLATLNTRIHDLESKILYYYNYGSYTQIYNYKREIYDTRLQIKFIEAGISHEIYQAVLGMVKNKNQIDNACRDANQILGLFLQAQADIEICKSAKLNLS